MVEQIKRISLYEQVAMQMMQLIESGEWPIGEQIPNEIELSQLFGVSRNCIREGLKSLTLYGILNSRAGKGTFVSNTAKEQIHNMRLVDFLHKGPIQDLIEARIAIECKQASLAAINATEEEKLELTRVYKALENALQENNMPLKPNPTVNGIAFHSCIGKIAHNEILEQLIASIISAINEQRNHMRLNKADSDVMLDDHYEIYKAIMDGEPREAASAMETHIYNSYGIILSHLE